MKKILPTSGNQEVDHQNLRWLIRRCDSYAEKLSASALHGGLPAHQAQTYRRAVKLFELLHHMPTLQCSVRAKLCTFGMELCYGMQWGDERDCLIPSSQTELSGCPASLVKIIVESLRLPFAKELFFGRGPQMNFEFRARASQLIKKASSSKEEVPDYSYERNFLLAPLVCPELGLLQTSKQERGALKALEKKLGTESKNQDGNLRWHLPLGVRSPPPQCLRIGQ